MLENINWNLSLINVNWPQIIYDLLVNKNMLSLVSLIEGHGRVPIECFCVHIQGT